MVMREEEEGRGGRIMRGRGGGKRLGEEIRLRLGE